MRSPDLMDKGVQTRIDTDILVVGAAPVPLCATTIG